MTFKSCPCCGEKKHFKSAVKDISVAYGQINLTSKIPVKRCDNCGAIFDDDKKSADCIRKETFNLARQKSVCEGLEALNKKIPYSVLERCFSLAPRTLSKWKNMSKSPSASAAALVNLLTVFPWLAYVGMSNYNPSEAYKIAAAAVLQKVKDNPKNFILPLSVEGYSGIALVNTNKTYNEKHMIDSQLNMKYTETIQSTIV